MCRAKLLARICFFPPRNILKSLFYFHLRLISPFLYCCCQEPLDPFRLAGPDTMQTNNSGIETDIASLSAICTPSPLSSFITIIVKNSIVHFIVISLLRETFEKTIQAQTQECVFLIKVLLINHVSMQLLNKKQLSLIY